jgi:uncharacterized protein YlzI (FlbEa/FlbD family)
MNIVVFRTSHNTPEASSVSVNADAIDYFHACGPDLTTLRFRSGETLLVGEHVDDVDDVLSGLKER